MVLMMAPGTDIPCGVIGFPSSEAARLVSGQMLAVYSG